MKENRTEHSLRSQRKSFHVIVAPVAMDDVLLPPLTSLVCDNYSHFRTCLSPGLVLIRCGRIIWSEDEIDLAREACATPS